MLRRSMVLFAVFAVWTLDNAAHAADVVLVKGKHTVNATIGDEAFLAFQFDVGRKKPFILPIAAPNAVALLQAELQKPESQRVADGALVYVVQEQSEIRDGGAIKESVAFGTLLTADKVEGSQIHVTKPNGWISTRDAIPVLATVTRLIDDNPPKGVDRLDPHYYDHPHHKGIWFSIDEVNGIKFWNEDGRIINKSVEVVSSNSDPAVLKVVNHWVDDKDQPVLKESTTIRIHSNRLIDYSVELSAGEKPVTFGDTKEGMFAIRVPNSMREFAGGGPVINAEGLKGTAACWGKPSPWVNYDGPIGANRFGVTVMDHPSNFRPSRYHVRDYGLFAISPFGESAYTNGAQPAALVTIEPGKSLTLRYAAWIHAGDTTEDLIRAAYMQFAKK